MSLHPSRLSQMSTMCLLLPNDGTVMNAHVHCDSPVHKSASVMAVQVTLSANGSIDGARIQTVLAFHAGPVVGVCASPFCHTAASAGADGTLRLFDYRYAHRLAVPGRLTNVQQLLLHVQQPFLHVPQLLLNVQQLFQHVQQPLLHVPKWLAHKH